MGCVRSSVTRMSVDQKHNVNVKTVEQERAEREAALQSPTEEEEKVFKSSSSSASEEESSEESETGSKTGISSKQDTSSKSETGTKTGISSKSDTSSKPDTSSKSETGSKPEIGSKSETEKQNELNRLSSNQVPRERDKPPITTVVETKDAPKLDKKGETTLVSIKDKINEDAIKDSKEDTPTIEKIGDSLKEIAKETEEKEVSDSQPEKSDSTEKKNGSGTGVSGPVSLTRSLSMPAQYRSEVPIISLQKPGEDNSSTVPLRETPSWRANLRKTGSSSMVNDTMNENDRNNLPRSASSPRLAPNTNNRVESEKSNQSRPFLSTSSISESRENKVPDKFGSSSVSSTSSTSTTSTSLRGLNTYRSLSSYKRLEDLKEDYRSSLPARVSHQPATTASSALTPSATVTTVALTTGTTTSISSSTITSPYSNYQFKRPYGIPKRDEEAETQRKARAKRARETRRSTQGVTREDIQKAEEVLSGTSRTDTARTDASRLESEKRLGVSDSTDKHVNKESDGVSTSASSLSERITSDSDSIALRRNRENEPRSNSFRRSRDSKDVTDSYSLYTRRDRSERNAVSLADPSSSSLGTGSGLLRSQSLRNSKRNGELESRTEEKSNDSDGKGGDRDSRRESSALARRRRRNERRSTGIVSYDNKDEEEDKEKEEETREPTEDRSSGRYGRYPSTSDVSDRYRSSPYIETSKSTTAIDSSLDYKRLYEDEKSNSERLKRELADTKKELLEAKGELDRLVKRSEQARVSDTNEKREKRALERKLSELEEELKKMETLKEDNKRLKEENGALIRVISKLSK